MNELQTELFKKIEAKQSRMLEIRRYLHEYPELSFHESKTAQYIADFYQGKDCVVRTNVGGIRGITVDIIGNSTGPKVALRADFDALPIQEETELPFRSKVPGVMHACGHDAHTAYMLILAESLIELKDLIPGTIRILHQPAEEVPPGGAKAMIEDGCLAEIDHVLGIHVMTSMETGEICYHAGAVHTGRATFKVVLHGKGGHGATPQDANDTIVAAAQFVTAVQTIVSRRISPFDSATVTIGSFDGVGGANIIKDSVTLKGDVRMMNEDLRPIIEAQFQQILAGICSAFGLTYELEYLNDYPVCVNDPKVTELVATAIQKAEIPEVHSITDAGEQTPSEDFAYYAKERPSSFFYVGAHIKDTPFYPHHHPKFILDEASLVIAAKAMASVVDSYFTKGV